MTNALNTQLDVVQATRQHPLNLFILGFVIVITLCMVFFGSGAELMRSLYQERAFDWFNIMNGFTIFTTMLSGAITAYIFYTESQSKVDAATVRQVTDFPWSEQAQMVLTAHLLDHNGTLRRGGLRAVAHKHLQTSPVVQAEAEDNKAADDALYQRYVQRTAPVVESSSS